MKATSHRHAIRATRLSTSHPSTSLCQSLSTNSTPLHKTPRQNDVIGLEEHKAHNGVLKCLKETLGASGEPSVELPHVPFQLLFDNERAVPLTKHRRQPRMSPHQHDELGMRLDALFHVLRGSSWIRTLTRCLNCHCESCWHARRTQLTLHPNRLPRCRMVSMR